MSILKHAIMFLLFSIIFFLPKSIYALTVKPYLVTEAKEFRGDPYLETVYFYKVISFDYQSGRVILSHNPDGTGEALVGEILNAYQSFIGSFDHFANGFDENGINDCTPKPMKPLDITPIAKKGFNNIYVRYKKDCDVNYEKIDQLYLVHFDDYDPNLTPFLDLPWDYKADGKAFGDVALEMGSFFDHEYPLLSTNNLQEPNNSQLNIINYLGQRTLESYSSHDGYDYGSRAFVANNDTVLASAAGEAIFINTCSACGNSIYIDHRNGYQTRYYHLQPEGLILNVPGQKISVNDRQPIGKAGFSGNVDPQGEGGAHIHFMVINDKNGDGNFEDNIPDGIVDPYGWQSDKSDPWENYSFSLNGTEKYGAKSHYLWKYPLEKVTKIIHSDGRAVTNNRYTVTIPKNFVGQDLYLTINNIPVSEPSATLHPIAPGADVTMWDGIDTFFTNFQKFFTINFIIGSLDISRLIPETLSIYSSQDGITWEKETSTIDWEKRHISAETNHLTQFAVMGEKIDSLAPSTNAIISGTPTNNTNEYTNETPVIVSINATDEPTIGSLGIDYTTIKINDGEWKQYTEPLSFIEIGEYKISYYSVDKDGNIEDARESVFSIANTIELEAEISFDFENNHFVISAKDQTVPISTEIIKIKKKEYDQTTLSAQSSQLTMLSISEDTKKNHELNIKSLQYNDEIPYELLKNSFKIEYDKDPSKKEPTKITQNLNISKQVKVTLVYNKKRDTTFVIINENGTKHKEEIDGFKKLRITTEKGDIIYSVE